MEKYKTKAYKNKIYSFVNGLMLAEEAEEFNREILNNKDLEAEVHLYRLGQVQRFLSIKDHLKQTYQKMVSDGELTIDEPLKVVSQPNPPSVTVPKAQGTSVVVSQTKDPSTLMVIINNSIIFFKKPLGKFAATLVIGLIGFLIFTSIENKRKAHELQALKQARERAIRDSLNNLRIQIALTPKAKDIINAGIADSWQLPLKNVPGELAKAAEQYERKNFDKAAKLLERPIANTPPDKTTGEKGVKFGSSPGTDTTKAPKSDQITESYRALYQGLILLSNQKYDEALKKFKTVGKPVQYEAKWYSALAYLKKGDIKAGRKLLNEIIQDSTGSRYSDAKLILESLN